MGNRGIAASAVLVGWKSLRAVASRWWIFLLCQKPRSPARRIVRPGFAAHVSALSVPRTWFRAN